MSIADQITTWRAGHPGERLTYGTVLALTGRANLWDADLRGANLWDANLWDANLRGADLRGANLGDALRIDGLPSGQVTLIPTPTGWDLRVGCWHGTPESLRALVAQDDGWPEAEGDEITRRRPLLLAALALIDAHTADRANVIAGLAAKWGAK